MNKIVALLKKHEEVVLKGDLITGYQVSTDIYNEVKGRLSLGMDYTDVMDILEELCEEEVTFKYIPMRDLCKSLVAYYKVDNLSSEELISELFKEVFVEEELIVDLDTEIDFNEEEYDEYEDEDGEEICILCGEDIYECCCHGCYDGCFDCEEDEEETSLDTDMCEEVERRLAFKEQITDRLLRYIDVEEVNEDDKYVVLQRTIKDMPTGIKIDVVKNYFDTLTDLAIYFAEQVVRTHEEFLFTDTYTLVSPLDIPTDLKERFVENENPFVQTVGELVDLDSDYVFVYGILGTVEENELIINQVYKVREY